MTPDELKRLEEQTVEAFKARRKKDSLEIECSEDALHWYECRYGPLQWSDKYYRIKPAALTPKTVEAREWDAWVDKFGDIWSLDEVEEAKEGEYINKFNLKPIRVREVIDTPKEPKERREYQGWVHDGDGDMVEVSDWEIVMRGLDPVKVGYRLATLVEKGGRE